MSTAKSKMIAQENLLNQKAKELSGIKNQIEALTENGILLNSRLPFIKRVFSFLFKKDPIILQIKHTKQELNAATIKLTDINLQLSNLKMQLEELKDLFTGAESCFKEKEKILLNSSEQIKSYKDQFGRNFAGEDFWMDIQNNESSQMASPWTDKKYDTLREELFYYGLMLQKAFILNSKAVKQNVNCLVNMWNGSFSERDKVSGYAHLLNTLFLVVPVVSTNRHF